MRTCATLTTLLLFGLAVHAQPKPADVFFPIGVWFEGNPEWAGSPAEPDGARAYYDPRFADLAARGFNAATITNCPEDLWPALLESAGKHGIRIVLDVLAFKPLIDQKSPVDLDQARAEVRRVVQLASRYPALLRYQTRDEPEASMIANWAAVNRLLAEADEAHPAFSCFCSPPALKAAVGQAPPHEVVFDIYPFRATTPLQTLGDYVPSLDSFSAEAGQRRQWAVVQSFAKPSVWRYPTPEELRAEVYLSLAAGGRGVFFFIYQSLPKHPEGLKGLVTPEGASTPLGETATQLARELRTLTPVLLQLQPSADTPRWKERTHAAGSRPAANDASDVRLTAWTDPDGRDVLIVASVRPDCPVSVRIDEAGPSAWTDTLTQERIAPDNGSISFTLVPGGGRVLVRRKP